MKPRNHLESGQTLIEVLVAIALAAILLPALATAVIASREGTAQQHERAQASYLLQEMNEAVRNIRDSDWAALSSNGTYHIALAGHEWTLDPGPLYDNGFTKQIEISDAMRDNSGALVDGEGEIDPSTKKVSLSVSWQSPLPETISMTTYLHRFRNAAWTQTTQADFDSGTHANTTTANASGGEVQLSGGVGTTKPSWDTPSQSNAYNTQANINATALYLDTDRNLLYVAAGPRLYIFDATNRTSPAYRGLFTTQGNAAITGVHGIGNYAALSTEHNTAELIIVNTANPASPSQHSSLNLGDAANATSIHVHNSYAYIGKEQGNAGNAHELYIVNLSNLGNPTISGSLNLAGTVNAVYAKNNIVYLATTMANSELVVVNAANKSSPQITATFNAPGSAAANDVTVQNNTLYLATDVNNAGPEYYLLDISNPANPTLQSSHESGVSIFGTEVAGEYAFLAMARSSKQFTVLNISSTASPTVVSTLKLSNDTLYDIVVDGIVAYGASSRTNSELQLFTGNEVAGDGLASSGTFESSVFDAGKNVSLNYLDFTATTPPGTSLQVQIGVSNDGSTWSYAGPDGTAATYFTASGQLPLDLNGRYIKYRTQLAGDGNATPVLENITINYSP